MLRDLVARDAAIAEKVDAACLVADVVLIRR
jgi:hypothetical protein